MAGLPNDKGMDDLISGGLQYVGPGEDQELLGRAKPSWKNHEHLGDKR